MKQAVSKRELLILSGVVFLLIIILATLPVLALSVRDVPNPRQTYGGWVTDLAGVLTDDTEQQLNRMIGQFEGQTTIEIAVVTVAETQPSPSPKALTTELFNTWGIGKARHNNGLLFLISVGERRVEIETGSGLESLLPSSKLQALLTTEITPKLDQDDFDGATLALTQALITTLSNEISASPLAEGNSAVVRFSHLLWRMLLTAGSAIGFTAICISLYRQYQNYREGQAARKLKKIVDLASVTERGWALFLDLLLLAIVYGVVAFLTAGPDKAPLVLTDAQVPVPVGIALMLGNFEGAFDLGFLTGWSSFGAALLIYRTIAEASLKCTFGQLAAGVRVVKADKSFLGVSKKRLSNLQVTEEKPLSYYAALVRNLMLGIDGFFIYLVGVVAINRSDKSQRLGDRLAQTVVVCRQINSPERQGLKSAYLAGGSFGIWSIDSDFGGGTSDGGGTGSDF